MVVLNSPGEVNNMEVRNKVVLVAQEITFVKTLASNDVRLRNRAIKKLRKWLQNRVSPASPTCFTRDDMLRIWKGLFYCMWMSDKPLVQEELADNICGLVHCLSPQSVALNFVEAFFLTMREEWFNIDTFRLNKFQMLVRRMLRQALALVARNKWLSVGKLADILWTGVLRAETSRPPPLGLGLHVCEIFIEELAKVSSSAGLSQKVLTTLLAAFARCLANKTGDARLRTTVCSQVFGQLIRQSDQGLDHQDKIEAWRRMGCPAIQLDQLERVEVDDEAEEEVNDDSEPVLDPRAGQLDVHLSQIPFNPTSIASMLRKFISEPATNAKAKRRLKFVAQKFEALEKGKYPLSFSVPIRDEDTNWDPEVDIDFAAQDLLLFEEQLARDEVEGGVASARTASNVKAQQESQVKARKRKARRKPCWQVTSVVVEEGGSGRKTRSPGTLGQWEVSPVRPEKQADWSMPLQDNEEQASDWSKPLQQEQEKACDWSKPLQAGEYEYFVEPRRSKRASGDNNKRRSGGHSASQPKKQATPTLNVQQQATPTSPKQQQATPTSPKHQQATPQQQATSPKRQQATPTSPKPTSPSVKQQTTLNTVINANISKIVTRQSCSPGVAATPPHTPASKKRRSQDATFCTPLSSVSKISRLSVSSSAKKVDIQLQHNKFQDLHQHVQQIKNSPGIPHDPNKKPTKSLLKTPTSTSSPLSSKKRASLLFC